MNKSLVPNHFSIFVRLDEQTVHDYFNHHDPAPLYKRQLGHEFEQYIYNSLLTSQRNAIIKYQVICLEYSDKRFIEPVTQAIRSHFNLKKFLKAEEFKKFKRRTFKLLLASLAIVLTFQALGTICYRRYGSPHGRLHSQYCGCIQLGYSMEADRPVDISTGTLIKKIFIYSQAGQRRYSRS
jgi:hypothetical protein